MIKERTPSLMNAAAEQRLVSYFDRIGDALGRRERRESFAVYALGIFGAEYQILLHFALDSTGVTRTYAQRRSARGKPATRTTRRCAR